MERYEPQNLQLLNDNLNNFSAHFLKRALQFLISISLLFLLLCYSFFPDSFNASYSTMLFSFFTHPIDRKYMFVVCNGILVFLAKGSSSRSSSSPLFDFEAKSSPATDQMETSVGDQLVVIGSVDDGVVAIVAEDQEHKEEADHTEDKEGGNASSYAKSEDENESEGGRDVSLYAKTQEENESEDLFSGREDAVKGENWAVMNEEIEDMEAPDASSNEELLSTDELNRKIEEFIRKMKEEIRIEAQQQLIVV